jgi:integrase
MDEIRLLAGSEAYRAKDAARRLQEMTAQSRLQVIEAYFAANPEVKRWVDRNIEAGTCAAAVSELREKKEEWRQEQRGEAVQRPERDPAFEWLREAARGCAKGGEGMGHDRPNPDMDWYAGVSRVRNVTPRCPFASVGLATKLGNHSFRATGITAYLKNGGTLEKAAAMANHASTRTTQLYDRRRDELSLDEVERIVI